MARVVLPLLGVEARGKIGNAIVYMPIPHAKDGLTSVRVWTIPKNPQSATQGDVRLRLKAAGYGVSFIVNTASLALQIKAVTPATKIWNAHFVKTMFGDSFAAIDASLTAFDTATNSADWQSVATSLGLVDQDISYASIDPITMGEVVFCAARAAFDLGLAIAPADAQDMSDAQVEAFAAAYLV